MNDRLIIPIGVQVGQDGKQPTQATTQFVLTVPQHIAKVNAHFVS